jgi:hypothetical protein
LFYHLQISPTLPLFSCHDLDSKWHHGPRYSNWDFQPRGAKTRAMPVDFSAALDVNLYVKVHQKMEQRPIVAHLSLKGMLAREIHNDIVATLGRDAASYSSVTRYLRDFLLPNQNFIQPTFKEISMIQIELF